MEPSLPETARKAMEPLSKCFSRLKSNSNLRLPCQQRTEERALLAVAIASSSHEKACSIRSACLVAAMLFPRTPSCDNLAARDFSASWFSRSFQVAVSFVPNRGCLSSAVGLR